jgi:serine/threonine-protein kinase
VTPEGWRQVKSVLDRALSVPEAERHAWLEDQLEEEPALKAEVISLLAAYGAGKTLLEPAGGGDAEPARIGDQIGSYRLVREIGRGGMGVVYLAERDDEEFERTVALKVLRGGPGAVEIEQRFLQERQILARLDHPGIARLLDGGRTADGSPYLVMEYVEGDPIDAYCNGRSASTEERLELFLAICSAVDFAHRNLVVHRDLKPGNVLVSADGVPKLLDFGIAKLLHADLSTPPLAETRAGLWVMTPEYASPEQMRGDPITTATDVYSLGVMLYELIAGRRPYDLSGRALPEIARMICEQEVAPPSTAARDACSDETRRTASPAGTVRDRLGHRWRGDLDAIVLKALRKEPEQRYASAEQFAADLRRLQAGLPVLARQGSFGYRASKFLLRHRFGVAAAAAFAVLLVLFVTSMALQVARTTRALERAETEAAKAATVQGFLQETFEAANPLSNEGRHFTVEEALDRARERLERSFSEQPEIEAAVRHQIGKLYSNMGRYDAAEPLLRQALATRRGILPAAHEDLAEALESLGLLLGRSGRAAESEPLLQEALAMRRRHGGWNAEVANDLELLARVANAGGDPLRAAELQGEAVEAYRRSVGEGDPKTAQALSSLADFERENGDLDAAETAMRQAAGILDGLSEPAAAGRGQLEMNLGELLEARGEHREAEAHYRAGLEILRRLFGNDHHWVAQGLVQLGTVLARQGRYNEAEVPLRQGVATLQGRLGRDHPDVATSLNNLAFLLGERGDAGEAAGLLREVATIQRRSLGDHPFLGVTLRNLGFLEMRLGRFSEARQHFEEALSIHRRHHGEDHPRTAHSLLALAWATGELGDWQQATAQMRRAVAAFEAVYEPDHPKLAEARGLLGLSLVRLGRLDEAESLLVGALPVLQQAHGPRNHRVTRALETLIELREARGQTAEAGSPHPLSPSPTRSRPPGEGE